MRETALEWLGDRRCSSRALGEESPFRRWWRRWVRSTAMMATVGGRSVTGGGWFAFFAYAAKHSITELSTPSSKLTSAGDKAHLNGGSIILPKARNRQAKIAYSENTVAPMEYDGRNDDMFVVDAQNQSRCNRRN
ncbi:hypothetical protein Dimus_007801 [Dionaea muscipula]